jgi:hypothetical protein
MPSPPVGGISLPECLKELFFVHIAPPFVTSSLLCRLRLETLPLANRVRQSAEGLHASTNSK